MSDLKTRLAVPAVLEWFQASSVLPVDDRMKLVICCTKACVYTWNRAYYSGGSWHGSGSMSKVLWWADFDISTS